MKNPKKHPVPVPALRVNQWLPSWDNVNFDESQNQAKPEPYFYLFSMSARDLRKLSAIYRRSTENGDARKNDLGIQRRHDPHRSAEISRYVTEGFPRSGLSEPQRRNPENANLQKPGWLPTAVVVNILKPGEKRNGVEIEPENVIEIQEQPTENIASLLLPEDINSLVPPIEVIDGQHRLFAFDKDDADDQNNFELPVVAFHGLDISWQAYLFWTINIKPKKINPSLAFDLYPLLREQNWLDGSDRILVYRESRAQELTEMLWATPHSPWFKRINMLGGSRKDNGPVTQAAFIRSLTASMVKSWRSSSSAPGGIFGGTPNQNEGIAWSRIQQGAFLIEAWRLLADAIRDTPAQWATSIRNTETASLLDIEPDSNPAFKGMYSLLATDQGVRAFQHILNDFTYMRFKPRDFDRWIERDNFTDVSPDSVTKSIQNIPTDITDFLSLLANNLATYDWRTSKFPGLTSEERLDKSAIRGSGGYRVLREQLVDHLSESDDQEIANIANILRGW